VTDRFGGTWLVTEYVHDPDGRFAGIVRQRRTVEALAPGRIRVTQVCEPDKRLDRHPMGAFAGRWVFEGTTEGALRVYEGPDVVGYGVEWSPGAMTSQGLWPRFGYAFESYGVVIAPDRQLTGGFFALAGRSVADIVGVAQPDRGEWPALDMAAEPPRLDCEGPGIQRRVGPLAVVEVWPSPTEKVRILALTDEATRSSFTIADRWSPQGRDVTVSVLT